MSQIDSKDLGDPVVGWPELQAEYGLGAGKWYLWQNPHDQTDVRRVFLPDEGLAVFVPERRVQCVIHNLHHEKGRR